MGKLTAARFITDRAATGYVSFTTKEMADALGVPEVNARASLRWYRKKGEIATPLSGFHLIVPPEDRDRGCLQAEVFVPQLMRHLGLPYYVGLLSAAAYHGAAHQRPQLFQVVIPKGRPRILCGKIGIDFISRQNAVKVPVIRRNTPSEAIRVSSPEATAFDLVGYERRSAGIDNVATILIELSEVLDGDRLAEVAALSPVAWSQRLGYLLETLDLEKVIELGPLAAYVEAHANKVTPLTSWGELKGRRRDPRWKVAINVEVDPDL